MIRITTSAGHAGIEMRGFSSQLLFPKKSYGFETRDEFGENLNVSLLGMPVENDWILYAPYSDKSLIRNAITYDLGRDMGHYASRSHFCEIVLNGEYMGVYLLLEKIKQDSGRVDIAKLTPEEIAGDELSGGYIVRIDRIGDYPNDHWVSPHPPFPGAPPSTYVKYGYYAPKPDEIMQEQRDFISGFVTDYEDMMAEADYGDPSSRGPMAGS